MRTRWTGVNALLDVLVGEEVEEVVDATKGTIPEELFDMVVSEWVTKTGYTTLLPDVDKEPDIVDICKLGKQHMKCKENIVELCAEARKRNN